MKKIEIINTDQGSSEWLALKLGVLSASCVYDILPSEKTKKYKESRESYLMELVGQIATKHQEEMNAKALDWGKANEAAARSAYAFEAGHEVDQVGFIYGDGKRYGCSPDALAKDRTRGVEVKCPITARVHLDFLLHDYIKPEYEAQVFFSMWVSGIDLWDFVSFHPRFEKHQLRIKTFERSAAWDAKFDEEVPKFIAEMDGHLKTLGITWGSQWV